MKSLRLDMTDMPKDKHPQVVIEDLGIEYKDHKIIPVADAWIFYDCTNIPEPLPKYLDFM